MERPTPVGGVGGTTIEMTAKWLRDTILSRQIGSLVKVRTYLPKEQEDYITQSMRLEEKARRRRLRRSRREKLLKEDLYITGSFACAAVGGWCFTAAGNRTIIWIAAIFASLKTYLQ